MTTTADDRPLSRRERIFGRTIHRDRSYEDVPLLWRMSQHDAQIYAGIVAVLVPLLGLLLPGDNLPKMWIYFVLLMVSHLFWFIELYEIIIQVDTFKELDNNASDHQRSELQSLYWGVLIAVLACFIPFLWAVASGYSVRALPWYVPGYGLADWLVIAHTFLVGKFAIQALYSIITIIQTLMARIRRIEETPH